MRSFISILIGSGLLASSLAAQPAPTKATAATAVPKANVMLNRAKVTEGIRSAKVERIAPNRATLNLETKVEAGKVMRLLDATGKEVAVARASDGALRAEIDPQRGYILAPPVAAAATRQALGKDGVQFPARYVTFAPGGGTKPNLGGLFLRAAVVPLTWNDQNKAYATELLVGYEFDDGREVPLAAPKAVTFFAEGANARIEADRVTIERSGGAGYKRVRLATGQIEGETLFTARVGPGDELKSSVAVQREPGAIKLSLPSTELPAFGVGSGDLTVSLLGRDGMPIAAAQPLAIQLSSRRLHQPATLLIDAGKSTASAEIRTTGIGADRVVAQSGVWRDELPVQLVFPVAAIVAAVAGGALGGATRYLRNKGKRSSLLARRVIEGLFVGVILVGAAWAGFVGFELSTGILGTPFGAFVLAALGGYVGCVVLDRVAGKTFGGLKPA